MQILFCDTLLSVRMIYLLKVAINVMRFVVPILLIIKITTTVYKGILSGNDEKQEILKKSVTKIIAAVIIFLVPTLISLLFTFIGTFSTEGTNYKTNFMTCYNSVNQELLNTLKKQEEERKNSEDNKTNEQNEIYKANYEAYQKALKEKAEKNAQNNQGNGGSSYSSNLTDMNKQNSVYVKDGVFYVPKTASGKNCPTNPLSQGYNNKYGYNNHFWDMLSKMVEDSKKAGYNLKPNNQGCRSYQDQVNLRKKKGTIAAIPGNSLHGWGIASDLVFYKDMEHTCSGKSCPGRNWAHEHAAQYGLEFLKSEEWHIQPINRKKY